MNLESEQIQTNLQNLIGLIFFEVFGFLNVDYQNTVLP
jgi:hypothetical protein